MTDDIDDRLHTTWHDAAGALTPQLAGCLRAARRKALATAHGERSPPRLRWVGVPATALAMVVAIAVVVPRGGETPMAPTAIVRVADGMTPANAPMSVPDPGAESVDPLALDDDPDFHLWLADDAPMPRPDEVTDEPI